METWWKREAGLSSFSHGDQCRPSGKLVICAWSRRMCRGVVGMRDEQGQCKLTEHTENNSKMAHHKKPALFVMFVSTDDSREEK